MFLFPVRMSFNLNFDSLFNEFTERQKNPSERTGLYTINKILKLIKDLVYVKAHTSVTCSVYAGWCTAFQT